LAFRVEGGYLINDEVDGLRQHERYIKPEIAPKASRSACQSNTGRAYTPIFAPVD